MASSQSEAEALSRADAAETELTGLRKDIRRYAARLRRAEAGGPVDFRQRIADHLESILAGSDPYPPT